MAITEIGSGACNVQYTDEVARQRVDGLTAGLHGIGPATASRQMKGEKE